MESINADAYSRYERFAQLRAAYPNMDAADIFECIHDEEVNDAIAAHERSLDAIDSEPLRCPACGSQSCGRDTGNDCRF